MPSSFMRWIVLLFEGLGALAIIAAVGWYVEGWLAYNNAQDWPATDASVIATSVDVSHSTNDDGDNSSSYMPVIRYRYAIGGQQHDGATTHLNNEPLYSDPDDAEAFLADYPVGSKVKAYVDPEDASRAALIVNEPDLVGYLLLAFFGVIFAGAGAVMSRVFRDETGKGKQ